MEPTDVSGLLADRGSDTVADGSRRCGDGCQQAEPGGAGEPAGRQRLLASRYCTAADRRLAALWPDLERPDAGQEAVRRLGDWWRPAPSW